MSVSNDSLTPLAHSVKETILLTGLSKATIHRYINSGALVSRKHGSTRLVLRSSIEAFLRKDHASPPTTAPHDRNVPSPRSKPAKIRGSR